ncbi:MAG: zf-HC2 domain-containing protein [Armatimonadota bacterium]
MMERLDCEIAERLIHLKLDGELREHDRRLLTEHVERCENCRRLHEELSQVDAALREGLAALEMPEPDVDGTRQKIDRARRPRRSWSRWLPAAAAALLVATVTLIALPRLGGPGSVAAAPAMVVSGGDAVHVFEPDQKTAQSRRAGTQLQEHSVAWGLGGEPILLEFADGARVGLSNEAVVRIGRKSIDLFKGGLRVDLEDADEDFTVVTPWGEFSGPGSLFIVHSDADAGSARIDVYSGEVTVSSRGAQQVLTEGQTSTLKPDPERAITL